MTTIFEPLTTGTVSIQEANAYKALSPCVRDCIYTRGSNNDIEGALKCGDDAIYNTCFCDTASRSTATSFLSSCILTKCAFNANSLVAAVTVYEKYCTLEPIPLTIPTSKTTKATTPPTATPTPTATPPVTATTGNTEANPHPTNATDSSAGATTPPPVYGSIISAGAIAGIVIGAILAVIAGVILVMCVYRNMNNPKRRGKESGGEVIELPGDGENLSYGNGHGYGNHVNVHAHAHSNDGGQGGYEHGQYYYPGMIGNANGISWGRIHGVDKDAMVAGVGSPFVEIPGDSPVEIYSEEKRSELR